MPKCCEKCKTKDKDNCANFRKCVRWREWFSLEWAAIKEYAQQVKEQNEE